MKSIQIHPRFYQHTMSFLSELRDEQIKMIHHSDTTQEDSGVDYAAEYRKQTGKDLETGEYVTQ